MTFTENDKLKAMAIVHIFETSQPLGDYAACVVLNDGAGVSYGINQFTHRSGSLAAVVEHYLNADGQNGRDILAAALPGLKRTSVSAINLLASDERFKRALRAAAVTEEMKSAQKAVAFERYLGPAIRICEKRGFTLPLSLAVVYDSVTHGSWEWISRTTGILPASKTGSAGILPANETAWITEYVRKRHTWLTEIRRLRPTNYRTKFFLDQIAIGNWDLRLPVMVHGLKLTAAMTPSVSVPGAIATGELSPMDDAKLPSRTGEVDTGSGQKDWPVRNAAADGVVEMPTVDSTVSNPEELSKEKGNSSDLPPRPSDTPPVQGGSLLSEAADKFDRANEAVTAVTSRTDAAKSLWTTVGGTIWQSAWAVFGFLVGLPKMVWIVVAVIAAALMLAYLYRQIELGRMRERNRMMGRV